MIAVGDKEQEIFLGREFAQRREISERTAQMVDDEVKRLLDEAYARARRILSENRELLDRIADGAARARDDRPGGSRSAWSKDLPLPPRSLPPPTRRPHPPARRRSRASAPPARRSSGHRRPNPQARERHAAGASLPLAVRDALRSHGWEEALAATAAGGLSPLAFHLTGLDPGALEALVRHAGDLGLEVVTGDDWAAPGRQSFPPQCLRPSVAGARAAGGRRDSGRARPARGSAGDLATPRGGRSRWIARSSSASSTSRPTASATAADSPALDAALAQADRAGRGGRHDRRHRRRVHPARAHRVCSGGGGAAAGGARGGGDSRARTRSW